MKIIKRMKAHQKQQRVVARIRRTKLLHQAKTGIIMLDEAWLMFKGKNHPTFQTVENVGNTKHTFYSGTTGYGKNSDIPLDDRKPIAVEFDA